MHWVEPLTAKHNFDSLDRANPLLQARDLAVRRGVESLFAGLNFEICSGQLVWLRGANGSGKTACCEPSPVWHNRMLANCCGQDKRRTSTNTGVSHAPKLVYLGHHNGLKERSHGLGGLAVPAELAWA